MPTDDGRPGPRVLVTGGGGFIGRHLVDALLGAGCAVTVLDDFSTGQPRAEAPGLRVIEGDVRDPAALARAMAGASVCVHLAAVASVERCIADWPEAHAVNVSGTMQVFDAARRAGPLPVIYASSAAVYGEPESVPIAESARAVPVSPYGLDKLVDEMTAAMFARTYGLPSIGLRLFNVYGPGQDPRSPYSGVISKFIGALAGGRPVAIDGDGAQTRDFVYVADVAAILLALVRQADRIEGADIVNLCTGRGVSVLELARILATVMRAEGEPVHRPPRPGDIRHSLGDARKLKDRYGLAATSRIEEGLKATVGAMENRGDHVGADAV